MCAFFGVSVLVFSICFAKILKFRGFLQNHKDLADSVRLLSSKCSHAPLGNPRK